ncbi:hypothetical protein MJN54_33970, partial [Salmonella enterica subsp. enterica serovar Kentucky]|nr:hypothetical protein [Salmonella enterica subsp. enterica serovar Kentucky]
QLPQAVVARTVSAITGERYHDTQFFLHEAAAVAKGSIRQLFAPARPSRPEACGLRHLAFSVENVENAVAHLEKHQVKCEPIRI